ncbi:hypothetical protein RR46_06733 [Papilio xuthus]|uniref:Uncharacterized protein n=1 Tax=Papilio xuthus TaxID=66420 RepID=A0A194PLS8_PAPXU|nr:hypothetical protein RR46_06733 [Papilio xuthus]
MDFDPFSQAEWSDSSDSTEPGPLPQLGYFVPRISPIASLGVAMLVRERVAALICSGLTHAAATSQQHHGNVRRACRRRRK